jgi:hypothetical protein
MLMNINNFFSFLKRFFWDNSSICGRIYIYIYIYIYIIYLFYLVPTVWKLVTNETLNGTHETFLKSNDLQQMHMGKSGTLGEGQAHITDIGRWRRLGVALQEAWRCVCLTETTGTEMPIFAQVAQINRNCCAL